MKDFFLTLCVGGFLLANIGCSSDSAKNRNAQIVANYNKAINSNGDNANTNMDANENANVNGSTDTNANGEDEEVPKFAEAAEALKKGDEYLEANKTKNALDAYRQSTELEPDLAEAHFKLGVAYALVETEEEAKVENAGNTGVKEKRKSRKKNSEKAFENAVKAYRKVVRNNRKDHEGFYNLGRAYNKLSNDKEAERALQKAVALRGEDSVYRTELGAVLMKLARYSAAIKQFDKAIELDEDNFRAEDLLVKAKAGRKRTGFKSKNKDENKGLKSKNKDENKGLKSKKKDENIGLKSKKKEQK